MDYSALKKLIETRRSTFPSSYINEDLTKEEILKVLDVAIWAPTHKKTEPWKFIIFRNEGLQRLSDELVRLYTAHTVPEKISERKLKKLKSNPQKASAIIAICVETHPDLLPEWEEIAATAMAVQNMWLAATSLNIATYWSSPRNIKYLNEFLSLKENEKCIGLYYMAKTDLNSELPIRERQPLNSKIQWKN